MKPVLPLPPLGEGWDGGRRRWTRQSLVSEPNAAGPHPSPPPAGEGADTPYAQKAQMCACASRPREAGTPAKTHPQPLPQRFCPFPLWGKAGMGASSASQSTPSPAPQRYGPFPRWGKAGMGADGASQSISSPVPRRIYPLALRERVGVRVSRARPPARCQQHHQTAPKTSPPNCYQKNSYQRKPHLRWRHFSPFTLHPSAPLALRRAS